MDLKSFGKSIGNRNYIFDVYFRRYYTLLFHFAYSYTKEVEWAEDIVQSVFIKLLKTEQQFDNEEYFKNYLYKSVRNTCLNELKQRQVQTEGLSKLQQETESSEDFMLRIIRTEIYQKICEAVETLPGGCKQVFKMAYLEQLDNEEIAVRLNLSINTVKVQKNKAKHVLRERLKGLYPLAMLLLSHQL